MGTNWAMLGRKRLAASKKECLPVPLCEQGTILHALIDACYSGGVLNLPYSACLEDGVYNGWTKVRHGDWVSGSGCGRWCRWRRWCVWEGVEVSWLWRTSQVLPTG